MIRCKISLPASLLPADSSGGSTAGFGWVSLAAKDGSTLLVPEHQWCVLPFRCCASLLDLGLSLTCGWGWQGAVGDGRCGGSLDRKRNSVTALYCRACEMLKQRLIHSRIAIASAHS